MIGGGEVMRTVLLGDIVAAARVLMALPEYSRTATMHKMLYQAHAAHLVFKRLGKPHPQWGNGSLIGRTMSFAQYREPFSTDPNYLASLHVVITALLMWSECRGRCWVR